MENEKEFLNESYAWIKYNPEADALHLKWRGDVTSEQYRTAMNMLVELMGTEQNGRVLNDDRLLTGIDKEDQQWAVKDWLPRAFEAGYYALAVVQTKEFFKKNPADQIAASARFFYEGKLNIRYFRNIREAQQWIVDVEQPVPSDEDDE